MGFLPDTTRQFRAALTAVVLLCLAPLTALSAEQGEATQTGRSLTLLQDSLLWIRHQHLPAGAGTHTLLPPESSASSAMVPSQAGMPAAAIPLSSAPARKEWIGQRFFLRGEDHEAEQTDRVRMGFEASQIPGLNNGLSIDGNWSTSQQPGDTTMDIGLAWQVPWGQNRMTFRGRHHEYGREVVSGDAINEVGGVRQTLEMDLVRSLYQSTYGGLDARVITTDVSNQWFENGDLTGKARRSYSLLRLDGHMGSDLSWLGARGDLALSVEGCVALVDGEGQEACGEQLGAFQRYNLTADLKRQWLNLDWALQGAYQFTPDDLPSWRYMEVGPGMMHGFGGQALRGREGGWVRLDSETPSRPLWLPSGIQTSLRFSLLRGWTEAGAETDPTSRASVGEVRWQVSSEHLSGGVRAGRLLESTGPGMLPPDLPDVSLDIAWTL